MTISTDYAPLAALEVSPLNARAHDDGSADQALAGMAESIKALGLLQPLVVHDMKAGKYGVIAGRRRLLALRLAYPNLREAPAVPIAIFEGTDEELRAASITENEQRAMMSDVDLLKSIQQIFATTKTPPTDEMLAQAFGTTVTRVKRLVRLAHVHSDIFEEWLEGRLSRRDLELFAKSSDPAEQKRVFDMLRANEIYSHQIADALGFGDRDVAQRLAFVTVEAYEAAGGALEQDLFGSPSDAKVLNPDILERLVNDALEQHRSDIIAQYPDRELTFTMEPMRTKEGYVDYNLSAPADWPDDVQAKMEALDDQIDEIADQMSELTKEHLYRNAAEIRKDSAETFYDVPKANASEWDMLAEQLRQLDEQMAELERNPKIAPEGATVVQFGFGAGDNPLEIQWWYPDHKAAGRTSSAMANADVPQPPKPGEDGYDPDSPALTNKAIDYIKAMRVNAATRFVQGSDNRHKETAATAHKALIFLLGWKLAATEYRFATDTGLQWGFQGDVHGVPANVDIDLVPPPEMPGLTADNALEGWKEFRAKAKPIDVDRLAAWVFARKMLPELPGESKPTVAGDVFSVLADIEDARECAQPDMGEGFFKLFSKKILLSFVGTINEQLAKDASATKSADMPERMTAFFRADTEAGARFGMTDKAQAAAAKWLPSFLRWKK